MDHVHLQDHIVIHKICQGSLICHNTANLCSCQENILWLFLGKKSLHCVLAAEIQLCMCPGYDIGIALLF